MEEIRLVRRPEGGKTRRETRERLLKVLVVDDEPEVAWVLERILERDGFAVDKAADGVACLDALSTRPIDLVLLDLNLSNTTPDRGGGVARRGTCFARPVTDGRGGGGAPSPEMDGLDVLAAIRERWPGKRVIVLTGHADLRSVRRASLLAAYDYLTKPIDLSFVREVVREALGRY